MASHCCHYSFRYYILGSNQFHALELAMVLFFDKVENHLISFHFSINLFIGLFGVAFSFGLPLSCFAVSCLSIMGKQWGNGKC